MQLLILGLTGVASIVAMGLGLAAAQLAALGGGAAGLCFVLGRLAEQFEPECAPALFAPAAAPPARPVGLKLPVPAESEARRPPAAREGGALSVRCPDAPRRGEPGDRAALVARMLAEGRYALLLRPQIIRTLTPAQRHRAEAALGAGMALVPEGDVLLGGGLGPCDPSGSEPWTAPRRRVHVEALLLDRYPVTNEEFQAFVAGGGYREAELWDPTIRSALGLFVDRTGRPGPREWRHGAYPSGKHDHPVVGVSWHEAAAYARWVGKRLPLDAEWLRAAAWPVSLSPEQLIQRRYPWGDVWEPQRANLWGGPGETVPVDELAGGENPSGVWQLIGNVWEWMRGDCDLAGVGAEGPALPLKGIRGGAFDTYFVNQATSHFQSGELATAGKPNIGFRCALSLCDARLGEDEAAAPAVAACPGEEAAS